MDDVEMTDHTADADGYLSQATSSDTDIYEVGSDLDGTEINTSPCSSRRASVEHSPLPVNWHQSIYSTQQRQNHSADTAYRMQPTVSSPPEIYNIDSDGDEDIDSNVLPYAALVHRLRAQKKDSAVNSQTSRMIDEGSEDSDDVLMVIDEDISLMVSPLHSRRNADVDMTSEVVEIGERQNGALLMRNPTAYPDQGQFKLYKVGDVNCAPGKCVELQNGTFMRITGIIEDHGVIQYITGQSFIRQNCFKNRKWARRHNEVVQRVSIINGVSTEFVKQPVETVKRNRHLILTNQTFPYMSSQTHPDAWETVKEDKQKGPLFCRWRQTEIIDAKGKLYEEIIERFSYDAADHTAKCKDSKVRQKWRQVPTIPGGEHTNKESHIDENGQELTDHYQHQQYSFGDTFCGGGGASCSANEAGLFVKFGVDLNAKAMETYKLNHAQKGTVCMVEDIHDFIMRSLFKKPTQRTTVDVLHISPPCQPFSPAHTVPNTFRDEQNSAAMFAVGELLKILKPRVVTLEETFGLRNRHSEWYEGLVKMFTDNGYSIRSMIMNLEKYGLPQTRRRLVIIAAGPGEKLPPFPAPTNSSTDPALKPLVTIASVINNIPSGSFVTHHDVNAVKYPADKQKKRYDAHSLAKTITCAGGIGNYHPSGKRGFTPRELAYLQRFPSTYKFADVGITHLRRQIGNAVPPYVFKKIYREIIKSLKDTDRVN